MAEIPPHELDLLRLTVEEAKELAAAGDLEGGLDELSGGLYRVETLRDDGEPWAAELAGRWEEALAVYVHLYGRGCAAAGSAGTVATRAVTDAAVPPPLGEVGT